MSLPIQEPPFHDDDTSPSIAVRPEGFDARIKATIEPESKPSSALGWLLLGLALLFSIGTIVALIWPSAPELPPMIVDAPTVAVTATEMTVQELPTQEPVVVGSSLPPLVSPQQVSVVLQVPVNN